MPSNSSKQPQRGDVWQVDLDPTRGREQAGMRPALILSVDKFNAGPAGLVIAIPITSKNKGIATHVHVPKGEAGLELDSYIKCEDVRSISKDRLIRYKGSVTYPRIEKAQYILRLLLGI